MHDLLPGSDKSKITLHELMAGFARIGATEAGGVSRLAASKEDGEARDLLCAWLKEQGFEIGIDAIGNIFGSVTLDETAPDRAVFCGSHLDGQPNGGRFDGTYGVVAACCAAALARDVVAKQGLSAGFRRLVVVDWTNEEGARFQPSLLGSGVFTGRIPLERALAVRDAEGIQLSEALGAIGYDCNQRDPLRPDWYVEIHVEQGALLETAKRQVGVVTHCWGTRKLQVQFSGEAAHTGPTPMADRRDALRAAALMIADVSTRALASGGRLHGSVGRIEVMPNSPNVVPQTVDIWVEYRSGDAAVLDAAETALEAAIISIQRDTGCKAKFVERSERPITTFDAVGIEAAETALERLGLRHMRMATVAGHDAVALGALCRTILLFVPSVGGVSHAPEEHTADIDLENGLIALVEVLLQLVVKRDSSDP